MSVKAVVFDVDGTLVESEGVWDEVRRGLAAQDRVPWPDEATAAMIGLSTGEWSRYLVERVGIAGTPEDAARRTIEGMVAAYGREDLTIPGAADAVRRIAERYPVAVASSSPPVLIEAALASLGIRDAVSVEVSTEQVPRGKPFPDGYLKACEELGVEPAEAVAVEDSRNGIRSALEAGMAVVAIPPAFHPPPAHLLAKVPVVLDSIEQLTPDVVEAAARRARV